VKKPKKMKWVKKLDGYHLMRESRPTNQLSLCGTVMRYSMSFHWAVWLDAGPISKVEGYTETLEAAKFNVETSLRVLGGAKL